MADLLERLAKFDKTSFARFEQVDRQLVSDASAASRRTSSRVVAPLPPTRRVTK